MKRYLPFIAVLGLVALAAAFAACSSGSDGDAAEAGDGADAGDGPAVSAVCAPGHEDCEDMIVNGDGGPIDCGEGATAPECVADEPPALDGAGTGAYDVSVDFTQAVTQAEIDNVTAIIQSVDPDAEVLVLERFPPAASATVNTDDAEACAILEEQLLNAASVAKVSCGPALDDVPVDPDAPVTNP